VFRRALCTSCRAPHLFCAVCHRPLLADADRALESCGTHQFSPCEVSGRYSGPKGDLGGSQLGTGRLDTRNWQVQLRDAIGTPVLRHGILYVPQSNGAIRAFDASDGTPLANWQQPMEKTQPSGAPPPTLQATQTLLYSLWNGRLSAHSLVSNELRFERPVPSWVESVLVGETNLFVFGAAHAAVATLERWLNEPEQVLPPPSARVRGHWRPPCVAATEERGFFFAENGALLSRAPGEDVGVWWKDALDGRALWLGVNSQCGVAILEFGSPGEEGAHRILWFDPTQPKGALLSRSFRALHPGAVLLDSRVVVFERTTGEFIELRLNPDGSIDTQWSYLHQSPGYGEAMVDFCGAPNADGGFDLYYLYGVREGVCRPLCLRTTADGARGAPRLLGGEPAVGLDPAMRPFLLGAPGGAITGEREPLVRLRGRSSE